MAQWKTLKGIKIESIYSMLEDTFRDAHDLNYDCMVYVGTDSQNVSVNTSFVQVVAVHINRDEGRGDGGRVFYVKHMERRYISRPERLLREAELSINLAQKISPVCEDWGINFEVHADVHSDPGVNGENKSHEVHDAVKGWIEGMGFVCKTKPGAWVASIVADYHVRGIRTSRPARTVKKRSSRKRQMSQRLRDASLN